MSLDPPNRGQKTKNTLLPSPKKGRHKAVTGQKRGGVEAERGMAGPMASTTTDKTVLIPMGLSGRRQSKCFMLWETRKEEQHCGSMLGNIFFLSFVRVLTVQYFRHVFSSRNYYFNLSTSTGKNTKGKENDS